MKTEEINRFIDCMTYEDNTVKLFGKVYWCLGLTYDPETKIYSISVFEADPVTHEGIRDMLFYKSKSRDDCMKHFLEDKYWDGKSFYEIANNMEWIDL